MSRARLTKLYRENVVVYKFVEAMVQACERKLMTADNVNDISELVKMSLEERRQFKPIHQQVPPTSGICSHGVYQNICHECYRERDTDRCKHGVHGYDCFECYPRRDNEKI